MRFAVISDTHVHPWSAFSTGSGLDNARMRQTLKVVRDALQWARDNETLLVHAGDWIHTTGHARHAVTSAVWDLLSEYQDVPVVTVWGNHDSRGRGGRVEFAETFLRPLDELDNFHVLDGGLYSHDGITFTGLGAQPERSLLDLEALAALGADVCVLHDQVAGASFPSGTVAAGLDPDVLLAGWPLSVVGDIHHPHVHREGGRLILLPGAPEHHNFGDHGPRGWWTVDVDPETKEAVPEMVESDSPRFLTVSGADEVRPDGNFYRITGPVDDLPDNATAVASGPTTVEARDVLGGANEVRDVLDRWVRLNPPGRAPYHHVRVGLDLIREADVPVPRMVRARSLRVQDFFSHEDTTWPLTPGVHAIVGRSQRYDSNGAGKSTLPEALYWCVYGKTTKGVSAADVVRWGRDEARVTLTAELEGQELVVVRTRSARGATLTVTLDERAVEAPTTRELDARLVDMLGMPEDLFRSLGYFSQEDVVMLSRATDGQIKDRLADLSGARAYEEAAVRARDEGKRARLVAERAGGRFEALDEQLEGVLEAVESRVGAMEAWTVRYGERVNEARERAAQAAAREETRMATWAARLTRARKAVARRKDEMAEAARDVTEEAAQIAQNMTAGYDAERVRFVARAQQLEGRASQRRTLDELRELRDARQRELEAARERVRGWEAAVRECRQDLRADNREHLRAELRRAEKNLCPTCGQELPSGQTLRDSLREQLDAEEARVESAQARLDDAQRALDEAPDEEPLLDALETLHDAIRAGEELATVRGRIADLEEKMALVQGTAEARAREQAAARLRRNEKALDDRLDRLISACEDEARRLQSAVASAHEAIERVEQEANPHRSLLEEEEAREAEVRRRRWSAHRERRGAERRAQVADYWVEAMGKSGIQSVLMDQLAARFNAVRGRVFPTLTRGVYDVQFSTTSRTAAGDLREKVEFQVHERGTRVPYANLSGGQRRRVDLGVLLTMTMAASAAYGIRGTLGVMALDEVASFLDGDGAEALAETLEEYAGTDEGSVVDSVWVVSQETALQSLFSSTLLVEQDEAGVSSIR